MIGEHHKLRHYRNQPSGLVEAFRQADLVDVSHGLFAFGLPHAMEPQDHGFMYGWSFYDLDGHHWEVFWMDPSAVQG